MGSLCSKSGTHTGGHTVLRSSGDLPNPNATPPFDQRAAAAEAAERRLKAAQARGTTASNPKQGRLAAQAAKHPKNTPEPQQEERLVWD